jgi:hypothetical protein
MISGNLVEEILIKWSCLTYNWTLVIFLLEIPISALSSTAFHQEMSFWNKALHLLPLVAAKSPCPEHFCLAQLDAKIALAGLGISGRYFPPS